jgi:transcriptional regulator CtsR
MISCKKLKEATHSGGGSVKIRKYIYSDKLRFLQKLTIERGAEDIVSY